MKKILLVLLCVFSMTLFACGDKEKTTTGNGSTEATTGSNATTAKNVSFKVITPAGSPALAQTYMQHTMPSLGDNVSYSVDVVTDATKLAAAITSKSHEFVYAPINLGTKMYNNNGAYQLAASVVFGNNYILTGQDVTNFNLEYLNGKDIILFGENNVPAIVALEILSYNNIVPSKIEYMAATSDTKNALLLDKNKIVLMAEPSVSAITTALKSQGVTVKSINLTEEWKNMTGNDAYPQAGIFVSKSFASANHDVVVNYLNKVSESIVQANTNPSAVAQMAVDLEYGFPLPVLTSAIPNSNLLYKSAIDSKSAVIYFLEKILESGSGALIGEKLPDNDFYFA